MSTSFVTVLDLIKRDLWFATDQMLTDQELKQFIFRHFIGTPGNFSFQARVLGDVWSFGTKGQIAVFYNMTFDEEIGCNYKAYSDGSIEKNDGAGSDNRTAIPVAATRVDYNEMLIDIIERIKIKVSQESPVTAGDGSYTPPTEERLTALQESLRGIVAL